MFRPFDVERLSRRWKFSTAIPLGLLTGRPSSKVDAPPALRAKPRREQSGKLLFDALEPRFLLNGEILVVDNSVGAAATQNHALEVELVSRATIDNAPAAQQIAQIEIINQVNHAVVAEAPLDATTGILLRGGAGKDFLTVDTASFAGHTAPLIGFSGGGGTNQLTITGAGAQTWRVTGPNAGSVSGLADVRFSQVGTLVGGSKVDDTFVVTPKGSLTGGVDGGGGGFDSLDFTDVQASAVAFNSTGPHSGSVVVNGVATKYAGLSPVSVSGTVSSVIVNAPAANDQTVLETDPSDPGSLTFLSQNNMLESASFTRPTNSLTVNLTGADNSLAIDDFTSTSGASLTVNATAGAASVDVTSGTLISTRNTGGGDPTSAPSIGVSGNVAIHAQMISVDSGANILTYGDSGFSGGVINLNASATGVGASNQTSSVTVDGATIKTGSLSMSATVSQTATVNSALIANADFTNDATVKIGGGAQIQSAGGVFIQATSGAGASVTATALTLPATDVDAAVASAIVTSDATAEIGGGSVVTAGGTVRELAANVALIEIAGNGSPGGSSAGGATVGLGLVTTDTSATIDGGASITAGGGVQVGSASEVFLKNTATATAQGATANTANTQQQMMNNNASTADGSVAVASAVAITHLSQSTQASLDGAGPISAGGLVSVIVGNASSVQTKAVASTVFGGAGVGAAVAINAVNVDDEASISGETAISAPNVTVMSGPIPGFTDTFSATALSGVGASPLGVAGALAINVVGDTSHAYIDTNSALTFNNSSVLIGAGEATSATATAGPGQSIFGPPDGIGASVAVNLITTNTDAGVQTGASLSGAGSLQVNALAGHTATTTAKVGATGGTATAAAVALTDASDTAAAHLDPSSTVHASKQVTLDASQTSSTTTTATGVVSGELSAVGAVIAIGVVSDATSATSAGEIEAGGAVQLNASGGVGSSTVATSGTRGASASGANANGLIGSQLGYLGLPTTLAPSAATADGDFGVSAAIGIGYTDDSISADQPSGLITAGGSLTLDASGVVAGVTAASAQPVNLALPGTGSATAVAINVGKEAIDVNVDDTVAASGVTLDASPVNPGADFGALAISGAGASDVGVAGAFALNVTTTQANATIDTSAQVNAGGLAVTVEASNLTHDGAVATAQLTASSPVGVGASIAVDIGNTSVGATIANGATVTNAGRVRLTGIGQTGEITNALGGASGGDATAASVALTDAQGSATALVASGASVTASSAVILQAADVDAATTTAAAVAAGVNSAIAAVIAIGLVTDQASAMSAGQIEAGANVNLTAAGDVANTVNATASRLGANASGLGANSAVGGQLGYLGLPTTLIPTASTADGSVGVAAALGVGYTNESVSAQQSSGAITAGGPLSLAAGGTVTGATTANAQSVNGALPGVGVGAAVAINVGKQTFLADLDAHATAAGFSLLTQALQPDLAFSATAFSGAGATQVGVAGSLALNVGTTQSNALIDSAAQVDAGGKGVTLSASNLTSNTANAYSQVNSKSPVGVGASVAINLVDANVSASEVNGAVLTNAGNVTFTANGSDNVTTNAIGGASGGVATAASVALTYAQESVTAQLQSGAQMTASGTVGIGASHISGATTTAAGVAAGSSTAVGAAFAVGIVRDTTLADSSGALDAQGAVALLATGLTFNNINATAGVTGADPTGATSPAEIAAQLAFLGNPAGALLPAVQTPDGDIGVSAAVAVGVTLGAVTASQTLGEIATPAAVSLRALGGGTGAANASAQTINALLKNTGVGGAVAVNVGSENITANAQSTINSSGLGLFAGPNRESTPNFTATAISGQSVAPVTVAGALAINVATTDTQAEITPTAQVDVHGGNVSAAAQGGSRSSANATAQPAQNAAIGVGASVAVNVVFDTTLASLNTAPVNNANNVSLTATSNANASANALAGSRALDASAAAISVNFADRHTTAEVTAGPELDLTGTLALSASGTGTAISLANASDIGLKNGLGTAIAVDVPLDNISANLARDVVAGANVTIAANSSTAAGSAAIAGALGNSSGTPADAVIASVINFLNNGPAASNAPSFPDLAGEVANSAGLVGLTLPSFEAAAAISANAAIADTHTSIADGVSVTAAGLVGVRATALNDALSSANSAASQSAGAIGLALGADYAQRSIQATIGQNDTVKAGAIVVLANIGAAQDAAPTLLSEALAVSSASGAGAGAAASIALDLVVDKTIASVGNGATLVGDLGIGVVTIGSMTGIASSGASVNASAAGFGVALALNLIDDQNQAFFGSGVHADSPGIIVVTASETQNLDAESQTGTGGGDAQIPASISVNVLLARTLAFTGADDQLNQAGLTPTQTQSILLNATDATFITGNAGVLGGHSAAGETNRSALVGASADFGFVDKLTQADLNGTATADDNIIINSLSTQLISSHAQSDGFTYLADLAGSAAAQMQTLTTNALIDAGATVNAGNNVVILSHDSNSVGAIADAHSVADVATAGAGIAAIATSEITNADVANNAIVNADGNGAPINVDSGLFAISYSPASTGPGQVGRPFLPGDLTAVFNVIFTNPLYVTAQALTGATVGFLDISPINTLPDNPDTSDQRTATPVQRSMNGLAITALSQDDLETSGSGYGAAFGASPELSGSGVVIGGATSAFIGADAQINLDRDGASPTQVVFVSAGTDTFAISLAGTISLAGVGAVGPAVTLNIIQPTTQAYIGAGAQVQTSTDVFVLATANEEAVGVATGVTAAVAASLAGSFPVMSIATSTFAYIDQGAVVSAPNNILVYAHDTTNVEPVAGVLSAGGAVGFGTSAAITLIGKDTQAWIGQNAKVDAGGFGGNDDNRKGGGVIAINPDTANSPFTTIHGLSVLANSSEQVTDLAVAGTPALLLGIAGSVSVELIGNTTAAHVDKNAQINASGAPASSVQTVAVGAYDDTETVAADVALDAGFLVQVGGAADLQVIRNNTLAFVSQGAVINAAQDVNIVARSQEFVQSFAGGAGLSGLVGINGSVSAVSIGDVIGAPLLDALTSLSGPATVQGTIDNTITSLITQGGNSLLQVLNQYAQGVGGDQPAATAMSLATPNAPVTTAVTSAVVPPGTDAVVVDATINAGRDVNVKARDNLEDAQDTSFTFNFSLFGSPLSINIDAGIVGGRANANAGVAAGATLTAGRNINVASDADANQLVQSTYAFNTSEDNSLALVDNATLKTPSGNVNVTANGTTKTAYSALLPGFSGLKLRLSYNELRNSIVAKVDDNSIVTASGLVDVLATDTVDVDVISNGCSLIKEGFLDFALAGSLAWNNVADTVSAGIDHSNVDAGIVVVSALEAPTLTAISLGVVESSDVAIGGGAAINQINNSVHAYISNGAVVNASGAIGVLAADQLDLTALSGAAAAVATVSVGAAFTYNIITDSILSEINNANVTSANSFVLVSAVTTGEDLSAAVGITEADSVTGEGSVPINNSSMKVTAQVVNSTVKGYTGVTVSATDSSVVKALAGSVVVSLGAFAAGAAVAQNTISDQTTAVITNSNVASSHGNVNVKATATPEIDVLAAGAGVANSFNLAGSVSINTISNKVEAMVNSHSALSANAINITATDAPVIKSITGALSIGIGVAAVSGSVSDNIVNDTTLAEDSDSTLTAVKSVSVKALSNPQIFALAAAGSASGVVSLEGAVTLNQIGSSTVAEITGAGAVITTGSVTVAAQDEAGNDNNPGIQSIAAGISLGSTVGVSGSVAHNTITDTVGAGIFNKAQINATTVAVTSIDNPDIKVLAGAAGAGGTVAVDGSVAINAISDTNAALVSNSTINSVGATVMATSSPLIESLALVGGVSGTVAVVASVTTNTIHSQTDAAIIGNSTISLGSGVLNVTANDQSTIKSLSGAASGSGTVAAAAALAFNTIDSTKTQPSAVLASINGSTVNAGSVNVTGTYDSSLLGIAISGSGAGTVAFGGSGVSNIDETTTNANVTNAKITLPGTLAITATDSSEVSGLAGNADGAGVASGGAAVVVNRIGNVTLAQDLGGTSKVGAENVSASATGTANALAVSGAGAATAAGVFDDTENIVFDTVKATIGAGAIVTTNSLAVSAADSMTIMSLAGSAAGASAFSGTGAHAQNDIGATDPSRPSNILASIEGGATVNAATVALNGAFSGNIQSLAIGVSGAGGVTGDASIVDSVIDQPVGTRIIGLATHVTGNSVTLTTMDSASILAIAGAAEGSGIVAAGASITTSTINDVATASIVGATVTASGGKGTVALSSQSIGQIEVFALAIGGSGVFSIQGAVDNNTMGSTTAATISGGANVTASNNVTVKAANSSNIESLAVSVAGAGGAGIGGAVANNVIGNQTLAYITGSTVTAINGGVGVGAVANGEIQSLSAGVAGAGILAVSGGVSINQIDQTIQAYVDLKAVVTANTKIDIEAQDTATIKSLAGQAAGAFVGIGGAVAYNTIADTVQAYAQGKSVLSSNGDIVIGALGTSSIDTVAVGGSGGLVGIAGSVAVANIGGNVSAYEDDSTLTTPHNVVITAVTIDSPEIWAGSLGVGFVGIAGTVAVETTETSTSAYTRGGQITALGLGSPASVPIMDGQSGAVSTANAVGLIVTAVNTETPSILSGTAAGGFVGVAGNVSVIKVENFTTASIGGSIINSPAVPGAAVIVRTFQSTNVNVLNGAAAVGIAGFAGAVSVIQIENTTNASITEAILSGSQERHETPAAVTAKYVEVTARGFENVTDGVVGVAAGLVGAAGSVSYVDIGNFTTAFINTSVVDAIGGVGAIQVNSSDTTSINPTTGAVAGGFVGAAAGVSVNNISNQTEANLIGAELNATGAITIDAITTATVDSETVAGAGGAVGIGAAVAVNTIESTTEVNFQTPTLPGSPPTLINHDPNFQKGGKFGVGAGQTVTAYATDTATIDSSEGAAGFGIGAAGAAIDVDSIRDHVVTEAQVGTRISAAGAVSLTANSSRNASTNPLAVGGGVVAIDGSITIINLGAELSNAAAAQFPPSVRSNVDSSLHPTTAGVNTNDGQAGTAAFNGVNSVSPQGVDGALNPNAQDDAETAVILDSSQSNNVSISSGGSLNISANNSYNVQVDAGSATGGLAGFGLAGAFVSITDNTLAQVGARSQLIAGNNLTIAANDTANGQSLIKVFAGEGVLIGASGSIGNVTLNLNVAATVGSDALLDAGGTVSVNANETSNISLQGLNNTFGLGSVGAANMNVTVQGTVIAKLADNVFMGAPQDRIGGLTVSATADNSAQVITQASQGGIFGGGQTNAAIANVTPHITAEIGASDAIVASGSILVNAASSGAASASSDGTSINGGLSLGESDAEATLAPVATAQVDTAAILSTLGAVTIAASQLVDGPQHQVSAEASASGGSAGIAGNGGLAIATSSGRAFATVMSLVQISAGGVVSALATTGNAGNASATGLNIGGIAADGGMHAEVDDNGRSQATFLNNVTVSQASGLNISAASADFGTAFTEASGGGLISLNGNAPDGAGSFVNLSPTVIASLGVADQITTAGTTTITALDLASGATDGEGTGIGGIDVGESLGQTTINPTVLASIGSSTKVNAGGNVNVTARQGGPAGVVNGHDLSVYNATGETTANADGSSGSLLGGGESTQATINVTGGISALVGNGAQINAGNDISISTSFTFESNATGGSSSFGGLVSVGGTDADTAITLTNLAAVQGSAKLVAGHNATVAGFGSFTNNGATSSDGGGGLASGSSASTVVQVVQSTQASVAALASIAAGNNLSVTATSSYRSNVSSHSSAGGLGGSDLHAHSTYVVGDPATGHQDPTTVFIGQGAVLTAPNTVNLTAIVQRWTVNGEADAHASAAGADAGVTVELDDLSLAQVTVQGLVTGNAALNVLAEQLNIGVGFSLDAEASGIITGADATLTYDHVVTSFILVPLGAVLETHALTLNAVVQELDPPVDDGSIDFNLTFNFTRHITFNGTALILSSDPTLTIASNGAVTADEGVNFSFSGGKIVVDNINDTTTGTVTFETSKAQVHFGSGSPAFEIPSVIDGSTGSIVFIDTLLSVNIDNELALPLVINGINTLDANNDAQVDLVGDLIPLNFAVNVEFEPTQINIKSASGITLNGVINNPIGDTSITSLNGSVLAGAGAQIIGETVEIDAHGGIGSLASPLPIVIVEGGGTAGLNLTAGQSVYIDLGSDLRTTASIADYVTNLSITAGGDISVKLESGLWQTSVSGSPYGVTVDAANSTGGGATSTHLFHHYHVDSGAPSPLPIGLFASGGVTVAANYVFDMLSAGGNIVVTDPGPSISVTATTTLNGAGAVSVNVSGDIDITEATGNLKVGSIGSTGGSVTLSALAGNIVARNVSAHVAGHGITLTASNGGVGSVSLPLAILLAGGGALSASAANGIYITEATGDMRLEEVDSATGDVTLATSNGSILDATGHSQINVTGRQITLNANGGSIGLESDHLTASSTLGEAGISATATGGVFLDDPPAPMIHALLFDDSAGAFVSSSEAQGAQTTYSEAGSEWVVDGQPLPSPGDDFGGWISAA